MQNKKIVTLVTGGNRGMGLELVRELSQQGQQVIMGARQLAKGELAVKTLAQEGLMVDVIQLDATDHESVVAAAQTIEAKYGYLTILINNAGAVFDFRQQPSVVSATSLQAAMAVNYFGLIDVTQQMLPLLRQVPQAKIINISSMMGSKTEALNPASEVYNAVAVGYQSAKAAANMYTVQLAKELRQQTPIITVNAIDPGMVATEFGGATPEMAKKMGGQPVEFGVKRTIELATDLVDKTTATFSNTHGIVPW
ncbi:SDR family NAD(P)-dependent oxidoreductase [Lactiplantibacillus mudanjiangensis]|uniref:Carbonyl reductase [Lactobacillus backii] n=1 Tax=Lactiplantibacillus mudanjiangensis TaxID=1296538 RepID=A0A660E4Y1_9LACO|nr:SDR family NAD(P)-dependent oxidoreductase [Lactiplantibacillus mudanjiangensis]VDG24299.1 carbonyl reductase [Lactobacillus backii] [Lactiplantibacillus mudanjiangensis]VDG30438.1 carbonyl reductase [Lactobacillus backii] [Lactiplantibacillus mudanjiangensis]